MSSASIGVLLANLGTPQAPTTQAVRKFLREFLSDPRVVDLPRVLWLPILYGAILPLRPKRVAKAYQSIWSDQGSPLLYFSMQQKNALAQKLADKFNSRVIVELGMNYGEPSLACALETLVKKNCERILLLPLYPQCSRSTIGAVFDQYARIVSNYSKLPTLRTITGFASHRLYIQALAQSVKTHWQNLGRQGHLLMSYHGVPERYVQEGDPYLQQCEQTSAHLAQALGLKTDQWTMTFQSRFGREPWLQPYTDVTLEQWAQTQRHQYLDTISPAFVSDCLETLEEMNIQNRERYYHHGGGEYTYIPALNANPAFIDALVDLIEQNILGWN